METYHFLRTIKGENKAQALNFLKNRYPESDGYSYTFINEINQT